jgi:hypothetical protein
MLKQVQHDKGIEIATPRCSPGLAMTGRKWRLAPPKPYEKVYNYTTDSSSEI